MGMHFWLTVRGARDARPRRSRILVPLTLVSLALVLPAVALASHQFGDVPTTHTFHNNISALANAGIGTGCGGGNYCPDQPVTRGQMAAFLNRGLGRIVESDIHHGGSGSQNIEVGKVTIAPGTSSAAVPGAKQYIHAQFHGSFVFIDATGCPCHVTFYLWDGTKTLEYMPVAFTATGTDYYLMATSGVVAANGSGPVTISLHVVESGGDPTSSWQVYGNLIAETVPFGTIDQGDPAPGAPVVPGPRVP